MYELRGYVDEVEIFARYSRQRLIRQDPSQLQPAFDPAAEAVQRRTILCAKAVQSVPG